MLEARQCLKKNKVIDLKINEDCLVTGVRI